MNANIFLSLRRITRLCLMAAAMFVALCGAAHASTADRITRSLFFDQRLVQVGRVESSEQEAQLLWDLLVNVAANNYRSGFDELEHYLAARANSPWAPSLDATLGKHYFDTGRYTLALEHWELAWAATKNYPSGNGKKVADYTLAHWTRLLASLGRYETLVALIQENRTRILDRGPLSQMWMRTREAVAEMRQKPGISYQCGTFAMNSVAKELRLQYDRRALLSVPSPGKDPCEKAKAAVRAAKKSIESFQELIQKHQGWINNPSSYPGGGISDMDPRIPMFVKDWLDDIAKAQGNIEKYNKALTVLEKAVDAACKCWYKPWTWFR